MVVVLGKGGRDIPKDRALEHVFGYAAGNEISVREYQFKSPQWTVGKNFDGTGAWGPLRGHGRRAAAGRARAAPGDPAERRHRAVGQHHGHAARRPR